MTQRDEVLAMLRAGWVCGDDFLDERLPRYSARIYELRRRGFVIVSRPCQDPQHHHKTTHAPMVQWRLIAEPTASGQMAGVLEGALR